MTTFGSLFSGIGGFDLGFERAGMECAWQCENDKSASEVLSKHWENVPNIGDVRNVKKSNTTPVDVICGGFPCQDVSVAGRRAGLAGKRSGLWHEFYRIVAEHLPRWVVIENVPGLLSSNEGKDFAVILRGLVELGYRVAWRVLDSQYFGVPQRRRRVFIVASLGNGSCVEVLFERESMSGDIETRRETGKDVAYSLRRNPSHSGDKGDGGINTTMVTGTLSASAGGLNRPAGQGNELDFVIPFHVSSISGYDEGVGTLRANGGDLGGGSENLVARSLTASNQRIDFETENFISFTPPRRTEYDGQENVSPTLNMGGGGMGAPAVAYNIQNNDGGNHKRKDRPDGGMYVKETDTSLTVGTTDLTAITQSVGVRRLTPTECARLQGFPDDWNDWLSDTQRYKQYGNAVTVNVAEWIGKRIVKSKGQKK